MMKMSDKMKQAMEKICVADAIIIGGGSGLSSACGYNHYHNNEMFQTHFQEFDDKYGIKNLMKGIYYVYSKPEQQWGFYARYFDFMYQAPIGQAYLDLKEIIKDKDYFILTTNIDMQFSKVFPEDKICYFQGDMRYFQCSQPCHDKIYPNRKKVERMLSSMEDLEVAEDEIPRCPICGWKMIPWVQDDTFLRGAEWKASYQRYVEFLKKYQNKKVVLLELGVGDMTPSIIQLPFWEMTYNQPETFLINMNLEETTPPLHLMGKNLNFQMDILEFSKCLRKEMETT
ncbi:MAG: NAD-dependent protein deacetylase, SIR2 family [Lachnospiraceae bacterium]|nr:NAD-dependent protein deacetylase, SIR2 family [Lachnospiraceae bacterium]MDD3617344.1 NAD-dependent protein deacetylase, SIR2 family [Lachnospiraceae bacterium]